MTPRTALAALIFAVACSTAHADISISNKPTSNMNCDAGVCTATAAKAVLNVGELQTMLSSGDVAVKTGSVAKDIEIDQPLTWSNTSRLTLDAQHSVTVKKQVTAAGQGALSVITNDTGARKKGDGEFVIVPLHGSVQFWDLTSSLMIDGNSYLLVGDIKSLAADIAANPSGLYALAKSYDASVDGTYLSSPVSTVLSGVFDGLGNAISNLAMSIQTTETQFYGGLFYGITETGTIRHVRILNGSLQIGGSYPNGGLLAGFNDGHIYHSSVAGNLKGGAASYVGGLVSTNSGSISNSSANVHIDASRAFALGGLASYNDIGGTISGAFSNGHVVNIDITYPYMGGLVGSNLGTVANSYSSATVKCVHGCTDDEEQGALIGENAASAISRASKLLVRNRPHSLRWRHCRGQWIQQR